MEVKDRLELEPIAYIHTDFPEKFGLPRQSGLVPQLKGKIVFEPSFRSEDGIKGLEDFSHIWLLWGFQGTERANRSATVRPPKLKGKRMGVFATRSPFRPNPIGLSCVALEKIETGVEGPVLWVSGIDLRDRTPIYDIKPYLPYADAKPTAKGGFTDGLQLEPLQVSIPEEMLAKVPQGKREGLIRILEQDPRPGYQEDPERIYGIAYAGVNVRFRVEKECLIVLDVEER